MRISFLVLFLLVPVMAFAGTAVPVTADKTSTGVTAWQSLSKAGRRDIIAAWKALPETTRPAFPTFRNNTLEKMLAPAGKPVKK